MPSLCINVWFLYFSEKYTIKNMKDMQNILEKLKYQKPVNYSVRASLAANSFDELVYLLNFNCQFGLSTLTIWCDDENDTIAYPKLIKLIKFIGLHRVFLEFPDDMSKTFLKHFHTTSDEEAVKNSVSTELELPGSDENLKTALDLF